MSEKRANFAFRLTAIYVIFGLLWILSTDVVVEALSSPEALTTFQTFKGSIFVVISAVLLFLVVTREIAARNRAEQQTRLVESAIEQINEGVVITGPDLEANGPVTEYVNPAMTAITGYTREELMGETLQLLVGERTDVALMTRYTDEMSNGSTATGEMVNYRKDGSEYFSEWQSVPLHDDQGRISHFVSIHRDVTSDHEARVKLSESEQRFRSLYDLNPDGVFALDLQGRIVALNKAGMQMLDSPIEDVVGRNFAEMVAEEAEASALDRFSKVLHGESLYYDTLYYTRNGERVEIEGLAIPIMIDNQVTGIFGVMKDVTRRNRSEHQLRMQLLRLDALHAIDRAITAGNDLQNTLAQVLEQIVKLLAVDAASIAVLDRDTQQLRYDAVHGFDPHPEVPRIVPVGPGDELPIEFRTGIRIVPEARVTADAFLHPALVADEDFRWYVSAPLIAKERVQGVVELFHRSDFEPDPDWFNMLDSMVAQAAIAIDNGTLYEDLKRSNEELSSAYDRTLEGWAHALEMRDYETQGHSNRVTAATLQLAEAMGIDEDELAHIRRGALLHDIGKMAIPDSILIKPGPLTEDEWQVMYQHPGRARQLLENIPFLRPAIDIPYYHHERWDGTGYPEGLKAEEIPVAARIFAVVDVWDALLSDRPYRKAWPVDKAQEYIVHGSGSHFDPAVVEVFMSRLLAVHGD